MPVPLLGSPPTFNRKRELKGSSSRLYSMEGATLEEGELQVLFVSVDGAYVKIVSKLP